MKLKDKLQKIALFLNRYKLGLALNRWCYRQAVRLAVLLFTQCKSIGAAYVKNTYATGKWTPGSSDVDLVLIVGPSPSLAQEFSDIRSLQARYTRLTRFLPMLGELEILHQDHLRARTSFTIGGYESRNWRRIYGQASFTSAYRGDNHQQQVDKFLHALFVYRHMLLPFLMAKDHKSLQRCTKKILRYLDKDGPLQQQACTETDCYALFALAFNQLHLRAQKELATPQGGEALQLDTFLRGPMELPPAEMKQLKTSWHTPLTKAPPRAVVKVARGATVYYLSDDPPGREALQEWLKTAQRASLTPVILSQALATLYFQELDPLDHISLLQYRQLLWGTDPFPLERPWTKAQLDHAVGAYSTVIFGFIYSDEGQTMSDEAFHHVLVGWIMRTLYFLEKDRVEMDYRRLVEAWPSANTSGLPAVTVAPRKYSSLERFMLLRFLADRLSDQLLKSSA